jgi:VCBS repeat-containing protein
MAKKTTKKHRKAHKVKVLKIHKLDPDRHQVELEIEGAPDLPIDATEVPLEVAEDHPIRTWFQKLFD